MKPVTRVKTSIAIGDIHGSLEPLLALLKREAIIGATGTWSAGNSSLIFLGDYMDRGEDGIGVLDLIMRLEQEALEAGGEVIALLGNHDVIMLEAYHFGEIPVPSLSKHNQNITFKQMWLKNAGGQISDLERLETKHVQWLTARPAMHKIGNTLIMHADSIFYLEYGKDMQAINNNIREILENLQTQHLDLLEERFASRKAFMRHPEIAKAFAAQFDTTHIIHAHTTIFNILRVQPHQVIEPYMYADKVCINLDHALCYGGKGFVYRF